MAKAYKRRDGMWAVAVNLGFEIEGDGKKRRLRRMFYRKTKRGAENARDDAIAKEGGRLRRNIERGTIGDVVTSLAICTGRGAFNHNGEQGTVAAQSTVPARRRTVMPPSTRTMARCDQRA
jgi:hypothetical protein